MRRALPATLVAAMLLLAAAPAWAHEEITPVRFKTQTPTFFTLSTANEKKIDMNKVVVKAPSGVAFGETTRSPAGWSVDRKDDVITWSGGAVKPDDFEQCGFEIDGVDKASSVSWRVTLGFADGSTDADVEVVGQAVNDLGASSGAGSGSGSGRAAVAIVIGIVALLAGIVALLRSGGGGSDGTADEET